MKPNWPTLEDQLLAAKVANGSALERLIRENQDFGILQPEEANDKADLPLWLRVYWRKSHPELEHPKANPGGGYPDALYTIYAWMLAHQDLPSTGTQPAIPSLPGGASSRKKARH
jgi:hypothetical protein